MEYELHINLDDSMEEALDELLIFEFDENELPDINPLLEE